MRISLILVFLMSHAFASEFSSKLEQKKYHLKSQKKYSLIL